MVFQVRGESVREAILRVSDNVRRRGDCHDDGDIMLRSVKQKCSMQVAGGRWQVAAGVGRRSCVLVGSGGAGSRRQLFYSWRQ